MGDRSGRITFNEFQSLHQYITSMQNGFRACDKDNSGFLDSREVEQAVTTSGYTLTPQTFAALMQKFDRNRRGGLTLDGYIELCCFLGTSRNIFASYDTQRRGSVTFSFDQFIYVSNLMHA
eukprot:NODE_4149_length_605_cov_30.368705_g2986_i0.p1 GENE.NODE_4149_length_605_cov_30.368705_g2986_i0~~NODE_4149_length_605_cov_30.368705_g2986_i0.p1  ORF type:complete len:129 (-),score=39.05 NODE_4149_length_605_cov_30.368705_g2986_i0:218-580(-)